MSNDYISCRLKQSTLSLRAVALLLAGLLSSTLALAQDTLPAKTNSVEANIGGEAPERAQLFYDTKSPSSQLAVDQITAAFKRLGYHVHHADLATLDFDTTPAQGHSEFQVKVSLLDTSHPLATTPSLGRKNKADQAEAFSIVPITRHGRSHIWIIGDDAIGAMYGGIEFAEYLEANSAYDIKPIRRQPHLEKRGLKVNIPLDARTPSYGDAGTSQQNNIANYWDRAFWREYLDRMASYRYNALTLWSDHPFPSLLSVPGFEGLALENVYRANIDWVDYHHKEYQTRSTNMVTPHILNNLELIKKMSIEDKIAHWKFVMQYAHQRGIKIYFITWNIFTYGIDKASGIDTSSTNEKTQAYFRASTLAMFNTYPLLAGIGITTGENMKGISLDEKEDWIFKSYGQGLLDAKRAHPQRDITFIHRVWWSAPTSKIRDKFKALVDAGITVDFSTKYSFAHVYASTKPQRTLKIFDTLPKGMKMWANLRNDDIFYFRWGDPAFVREYIYNMPSTDKLRGIHMGADGYVWGRQSVNKLAQFNGALDMDISWYAHKLWGRLSYYPDESPDTIQGWVRAKFEHKLENKFDNNINTKLLTEAWHLSSKIIPQMTKFYWQDYDMLWYVEACARKERVSKGPSRLVTVQEFIDHSPQEGTNIVSIKAFVAAKQSGRSLKGTTPNDVAENLAQWSSKVNHLLRKVKFEGLNHEAKAVWSDVAIVSDLGRYYEDKIRGALALHQYQQIGDNRYKAEAVSHLKNAAKHWQDMVSIITPLYRPQLLSRVGFIDHAALLKSVERDVQYAAGQ